MGQTKRGLEQKVLISALGLVAWFDSYARIHKRALDDRVAACSYTKLQSWLRRGAKALGFGDIPWSTHSLRRGGATELWHRTVNFDFIKMYGRWLSDRSARDYTRRGEVGLLRVKADISAATWAQANRFARLGASV